jgi:hypothetical protein
MTNKLTLKEFASLLNGNECLEKITEEQEKMAKELGFVVVFGQSDDLVEFRGAIRDEVDCYAPENGQVIYFDGLNILNNQKNFYDFDVDEYRWASNLTAFCFKEEDICWTYETDLPHENFEIFRDNSVYCGGIVFETKNLLKKVIRSYTIIL